MHTTRTTTALLAAGLLLAGCSAGGTGTPPATTPAAPPTVPIRDQFLQAVNAANIASWAHARPTDDELAAYPDRWCTSLNAGHSVAVMLAPRGGDYPIGMTWGTKEADAYEVLLIAVRLYCPAQTARVESELRAAGKY